MFTAINRIGWLFLLLLIGISLAKAQRENTVFDVLLTDVQTLAPFQTQTVRNIGQSSHLFTMQLEDVVPGSCVSPQNVDMGMEFSYGNGVWVRGGTDVTRIAANADGVLVAIQNVAGAFPLVRFAVRDYDETICQLTVTYSGAIAAFNVNNVAQNNSFLGIGAISTLANPSNLNIQYTPSTPTVVNLDITNGTTVYKTLWEAFDTSPWIHTGVLDSTFTPTGTTTCTCAAGCQPGTTFQFEGSIQWVAGASGSGYGNGTWQCNVNRADLAAAITLHDPLVNATFVGSSWTFSYKTTSAFFGTGFYGNSVRFGCGQNAGGLLGAMDLSGCSTTSTLNFIRRMNGGVSRWRTQTTPQGLQGCLEMTDQTSATFSQDFFLRPRGFNCATTGAETIVGRTDRSVQLQLWIDDYQAFSYTPGNLSSSGTSGTVWGTGVPFIPSFVGGVTDFQWQWSDNKSNTSNFANSWRNTLAPANTLTAGFYGGSVVFNGVTYSQSNLRPLLPNPVPVDWANSSGVPLLDALLTFNLGGPTGASTLIGQLWNAVYYQVNQPPNTVFVFDGFNWQVFTGNNTNGALLFRMN